MDLDTYLSEPGTRAAMLAKTLGVPPSLISQWRTGARPVPIGRAVEIELATRGKVTRKELRSRDWQTIWPELAEAKGGRGDMDGSQ